MGKLIASLGRCGFQPEHDGEHLHALLRAIVYQQLSGKAAATIHGRVMALYGDTPPAAEQILATPDQSFRAAGLSRQKVSYLRDLAQKTADGLLPLHNVYEMDDAAVERALTSVKGVGRWTAQMFLMFRLGRPDVLPDGDLGIRKAVQKAYKLRSLPSPERVRKIGRPWSPYSSVASWYLWKLVDTND
jgi:DNA-3-methyladenine glycosylase II